ncbi:hypothetical protein [Nesterenkonia sp. NBAIMH1]|uniref:hypothetical protein n=1 Tax=Nesterenkonia sp. NBAIMH1 TaxID=2600320 RepID=UPI0011B6B1CC|nr:hypothetical protein [Nesterenkonia sp. NBAIMH1]
MVPQRARGISGRRQAARLARHCGEHTVYIAFTLISGGQSFGFHDVYSENFESFSPGFVGRLALIGALMREPEAPPFDPGMEPTYVQAGAAFPSHREYAELLVAGPPSRARMAVGAYPALRRARTRLRRRAS